MSQITIELGSETSFAAEDYVQSDANNLAYAQLMAWPNWPDYAFWLYGPAHAGKSHLAAIWAQLANAKIITTQDLMKPEELLTQSDQAYLLDDISNLCDEQQAGLFHLLNHVKGQGKKLLLISQYSPNQLPLTLLDLQSRLKALPTLELSAPDDELLRAVWFKQFSDRQLQVSPAVVDYLMQRCDRSFEVIHRVIMVLDYTALEQKREITVPFVRSVLIDSENVGT